MKPQVSKILENEKKINFRVISAFILRFLYLPKPLTGMKSIFKMHLVNVLLFVTPTCYTMSMYSDKDLEEETSLSAEAMTLAEKMVNPFMPEMSWKPCQFVTCETSCGRGACSAKKEVSWIME